MTPFYQTVPHDPPRSFGDCHRTAIACILDLPPDRIPHIAGKESNAQWLVKMNEALTPHGYQIASIAFTGSIPLHEMMGYMEELNPTVHYILCGRTKDDVPHVVVCRGGNIMHDTCAGKPGVHKPTFDRHIGAEFWVLHLLVKV